MSYKKKIHNEEEELSLAEIKKKGNLRAKWEPVRMKYSPLVEWYLKAHKYETMNNVWEWKMLLTNWTDVQKDIDAKFKKYKQITESIMEEKNKMTEDYK